MSLIPVNLLLLSQQYFHNHISASSYDTVENARMFTPFSVLAYIPSHFKTYAVCFPMTVMTLSSSYFCIYKSPLSFSFCYAKSAFHIDRGNWLICFSVATICHRQNEGRWSCILKHLLARNILYLYIFSWQVLLSKVTNSWIEWVRVQGQYQEEGPEPWAV